MYSAPFARTFPFREGQRGLGNTNYVYITPDRQCEETPQHITDGPGALHGIAPLALDPSAASRHHQPVGGSLFSNERVWSGR